MRRGRYGDGFRRVGWDRVRARDQARLPLAPPPALTDRDLTAWLRTHAARLVPPTPPASVHIGASIVARGRRPRTATTRAIRRSAPA
jgi:hypothetical protein